MVETAWDSKMVTSGLLKLHDFFDVHYGRAVRLPDKYRSLSLTEQDVTLLYYLA